MYADDRLLMISGIQHYAFCPRQWGLITIEQQWRSNHLTLEGDYLHERVDNPECIGIAHGVVTLRAVPLVSYELGVCGISDAVELHPTDDPDNSISTPRYEGRYTPYPVEYKHGQSKISDEDRLQLCAQAMCLEEMYGLHIDRGALYYATTRRREEVVLDDRLRRLTVETCRAMHDSFDSKRTPRARYSPKCRNCSLLEICMPKIEKRYQSVDNYLKQLLDA